MCIFKRAAAFLLALLLVLNLPLAALAAEGDGTVPNLTLFVEDKPLKVGDEFVVTASLDATMTEPDSFGYNIQFDPAYVEFVSGESEYDVTEKVSGKAVNIAYAKPGEDIEIPAGEMAKLTFRAIQETEATAFALTDPEFLSLDLSNGDIASYDVNLGEAVSVSIAGEPGCGHNYVAGVCTECGEAEPGYAAPAVTVTLSLSSDDVYMIGRDTDTVMAFREITVPYFDLGLYGLEEYYFISETYGDDGDGMPGSDLEPGTAAYADGKVTLMHLYLYALEVFYCGVDIEDAGQGYLYEEGLIGTDVFTVSGSVGSSYMNQFWGGDCNLNYYVNYEYPLASGGWGATADQILLRDGDMVTLGHFSDWGFYGDPYSIFNYIVSDRETVTQGEDVTLTLYYAGASLGMTDGTAQNLNGHCLDVYCVPTDMVTCEDVTSCKKDEGARSRLSVRGQDLLFHQRS